MKAGETTKYNQDNDYKWFLENQDQLFSQYPNQFIIISEATVLAACDSFEDAMKKALDIKKAGEFIIQQCIKSNGPIQYYNRAVFF